MSTNNSKHNCKKIALYIHIPFCQTKCRYCAFYSEPIKNHNAKQLISALIKEINQYQLTETINTIYIGGGSPTSIPQNLLTELIDHIKKKCPDPEEFTVEVNPGRITKNTFQKLRDAGLSRISIGVQSFNQHELNLLGRTHQTNCISKTINQCRLAGFKNISIDLIFAIPNSTIQSWNDSLQTAIDLNIQHISAYSLTYEKNTPLQKDLQTGKITPVSEETDRQMYELAISKLNQAGIKQYEISNFAIPGFECKHNLTYWQNQQYIGIGPAAASYYKNRRTTNIPNIKKYIQAIQKNKSPHSETHSPTPLEIACETAVLNLRTIKGINIQNFTTQTNYDPQKLFAETIEKYLKLNLIKIDSKTIALTKSALPIADSILCDFSTI